MSKKFHVNPNVFFRDNLLLRRTPLERLDEQRKANDRIRKKRV